MDATKTLNQRLSELLNKVKKQEEITYRCLVDYNYVNMEAPEFKDAERLRQKFMEKIMKLKELWD